MTQILVDDNFTSFDVGINPLEHTFFYFTFGSFVADDAVIISNSQGTLISSVPFTKTIPTPVPSLGTLDHVKFLAYRSRAFVAPTNGDELVIETIMSAQQVGVSLNPFPKTLVPNPNRDFRLAVGTQSTIDLANLLTFDVFITNEVIYALYEHLPFNKPNFGGPGPDYAAFTYVIPIGGIKDFDPTTFLVKVGIAYNKQEGYVKWLVNGEERFRVTKIGFHIDPQFLVINHGGPETLYSPNSLNTGFGNFTLLDAVLSPHKVPTDQPALVLLNTPDQYRSVNSDALPQKFLITTDELPFKLFGQGEALVLKHQQIYTRPTRSNCNTCNTGCQCQCNVIIIPLGKKHKKHKKCKCEGKSD